MSSKFQKIKHEIRYRTSSKTRFDAHSPFLFDFIENVLNDSGKYYCYSPIERMRERLAADNTTIEIQDYGAGSKVFDSNQRRIKDIVRYSVKPKKYGQLLFRMANYYRAKHILELGTSLGVTTSYLSAANRTGVTVSIEGDPSTHKIASANLKSLHLSNSNLILGQFDQELDHVLERLLPQLDFVYIDGHHAEEPTKRYFETCLRKAHSDTILVMDDIHWSEGMERAWEHIVNHPRTTLCLDLNALGIVFLKPELSKQNFVIRY